MLTSMLAGPFMAMFANLVDLETSIHVMDRVILLRSSALTGIVKHVFEQMKDKILKLKEEKLHPYMVKQIYIDAVKENKFFPPISTKIQNS
jgi:hypothetical protein